MVGMTVKKGLDCAQYDHKISSTCICRNSHSCKKSDAAVNALPLISIPAVLVPGTPGPGATSPSENLELPTRHWFFLASLWLGASQWLEVLA